MAIHDNSGVNAIKLRQVLAANLRAAMQKNPAISTQPKLEAKSGVGQSTISRILKEQGAATLDVIADLAKAVGCQPWELLVDDDETREAALARMIRR